MTQFVDYIVDIAVTILSYLSADIQNDNILLYMAYAFCLLAVLIVITVILSLVPKIFLWVYNLFKRSC